MVTKSSRIRYSEDEAARKLGISVEQLRVLIKNHISHDDEVPENATFQPSDLIVLQVLATKQFSPMIQ